MAEKRYYWLKLQEDFFDSKRIKKLRRIAGGDTYTIIYLKMQLLAMKRNGVLEYTGLEPTFAEELALDLDEDEDNVSVTVNYLLSCGLLETSDDREYFVPYAVMNTGSEGSSAKRVREFRERQALHCNTNTVTSPSLRYGEKEIEIEKDIEIEKEDIEPPALAPAKSAGRKSSKSVRHKYGEYQNVMLTDEDLEKLKDEFPDWEARVERLSSYIASTGKSYKNHLATIRNWARRDQQEKKQSGFQTSNPFAEMLEEELNRNGPY